MKLKYPSKVMDASAPPRALPRLPGDVVDAVLAFLDVLCLSRACTTSRGRSSSDGLPMAAHGADSWRRVFRARWPPTSLFRLKARVLASAAGCVRRECALRANAARRDVEVVARPYRLRGVAIDDADGNATSVDATVVMGADYTVAGTAALSSGSLRGNAVEAAWCGQLSAWIEPGAGKRRWQLSFDETSPANAAAFRYTGRIALDGCSVTGTFRHAVFYKLKGTFEFAIAAVEAEDGG